MPTPFNPFILSLNKIHPLQFEKDSSLLAPYEFNNSQCDDPFFKAIQSPDTFFIPTLFQLINSSTVLDLKEEDKILLKEWVQKIWNKGPTSRNEISKTNHEALIEKLISLITLARYHTIEKAKQLQNDTTQDTHIQFLAETQTRLNFMNSVIFTFDNELIGEFYKPEYRSFVLFFFEDIRLTFFHIGEGFYLKRYTQDHELLINYFNFTLNTYTQSGLNLISFIQKDVTERNATQEQAWLDSFSTLITILHLPKIKFFYSTGFDELAKQHMNAFYEEAAHVTEKNKALYQKIISEQNAISRTMESDPIWATYKKICTPYLSPQESNLKQEDLEKIERNIEALLIELDAVESINHALSHINKCMTLIRLVNIQAQDPDASILKVLQKAITKLQSILDRDKSDVFAFMAKNSLTAISKKIANTQANILSTRLEHKAAALEADFEALEIPSEKPKKKKKKKKTNESKLETSCASTQDTASADSDEALTQKINQLKEQLELYKTENAKLNRDISELNSQEKESSKHFQLSAANLKATIKELRLKKSHLEQSEISQKTQIAQKLTKVATLKSQYQELSDSNKKLNSKLDSAKQNLSQLKEKASIDKTTIAKLEAETQKYSKRIETHKKQVQEQENKLKTKKIDLELNDKKQAPISQALEQNLELSTQREALKLKMQKRLKDFEEMNALVGPIREEIARTEQEYALVYQRWLSFAHAAYSRSSLQIQTLEQELATPKPPTFVYAPYYQHTASSNEIVPASSSCASKEEKASLKAE